MIELNNNGEAYPYFSNTVDNKRNSISPSSDPIKYNLYKASGEARLNGNWKVKYKWDRKDSRERFEGKEGRGSIERIYL